MKGWLRLEVHQERFSIDECRDDNNGTGHQIIVRASSAEAGRLHDHLRLETIPQAFSVVVPGSGGRHVECAPMRVYWIARVERAATGLLTVELRSEDR